MKTRNNKLIFTSSIFVGNIYHLLHRGNIKNLLSSNSEGCLYDDNHRVYGK